MPGSANMDEAPLKKYPVGAIPRSSGESGVKYELGDISD